MKANTACISCITRQAMEAAQQACDDPASVERVLQHVMAEIATLDLSLSPPELAQQIHRRLREESQCDDPYAQLKAQSAAQALCLAHRAKAAINRAANPFEAALRFAIAGNIIDFAAFPIDATATADSAIAQALSQPIDHHMVQQLSHDLTGAKRVLLLADNVGETFFDKLLIEQLPAHAEVVYAVKAAPVLNDATVADTLDAGIAAVAKVIDTGCDAPGAPLAQCSVSFKHYFDSADVVIAKGQANYETLCDVSREVYFLLQIKCVVLAEHIKLPLGSWVLSSNHQLRRQLSASQPLDLA
ncbi:damage-control phosphatase ARMT1 family protein [Shewanella sp.]|uniref:damage-control phosphatase ARMT1 family protein n=1 Tax=Shewanella sp. TaxID=50422 RepID=UPI003A979F80